METNEIVFITVISTLFLLVIVGFFIAFISQYQKRQRENGKSFVSRTRIEVQRYQGRKTVVFRVVLANPLTSNEILNDVIAEQLELAQESETFLPDLLALT